MALVVPPCMGCQRRRPGCHDPSACPDWAAFSAANEARRAAAKAYREEVIMMEEYHAQRIRYLRSTRRKEKRKKLREKHGTTD